jgi:queuosine precursor transporter
MHNTLPDNTLSNRRVEYLFFILSGIFITNAVVAELIGAKIFSFETLLGVSPAQMTVIGDFKIDFNLSAGVVIWPVVFIVSDIINEYFGKEGVKKISYATVGFIIYTFVVIFLATKLPPATFWIEANQTDAQGSAFNINYAYTVVFRQGLSIIVASITAFLLGQLVDAYAFHWLRRFTKNKRKWLRATGSTLISQLIDSFVVLTVAFYLLGNWTFEQVLAVCIVQYTYKMTVALVLTPVIYAAHYVIGLYIGTATAQKLAAKAMEEE